MAVAMVRPPMPQIVRQNRIAAFVFALCACEESGGGGAGGAACASQDRAIPAFELTITTEEQLVPSDLTLVVTWSSGQEPAFHLDDVNSWHSLDEANVVCQVTEETRRALLALTCDLWTRGATEVEVSADGFETTKQTLNQQFDDCENPRSTPVSIVLGKASEES